ncbi:hypothetical protein F5Y17DRAFT_431308 [Xylariaceae sp. FL0594]|nr:hypothetical protein F5Y17DRAFT_431308 [Xylariaceae sp. FL0594]
MAGIVNHFRSQGIEAHDVGDTEYERSVATANLLFRYSRPACVVKPSTASHVQAIIAYAKSQHISVTIKNGGHSYAGFSTTDNGILLDLGNMKRVVLDMDSKLVTLQGGALWGNAYKALVNGRHDGFMINGGRCPTVGVSGFTLGGGLGPFTRSLGLGCDTLKEATIVTADRGIVTVRDSDDPSSDNGRLFWALCGAGGGNFGVVVEMKTKVMKLQNPDGVVVAGRYTWSPRGEALKQFETTMNRFYTANWPHQLTIDTSWICDLRDKDAEVAVRFITYYDGSKEDFDDLIDRHIDEPELKKQLKRRSLQEKTTRFLHETLVTQWSEETIKAFPSERSFMIYTSFVFKNDSDRIQEITSAISREMEAFRRLYQGEKATLQVTWIHSGGKASERERSATAFYWRECTYHVYIMIQWEEKWIERDMRGFMQTFKEKLRPHSIMGQGSFINFPDQTLPPTAHERVYYGDNRRELRKIKAIWDKDDFFNWAQGIRLPKQAFTGPVDVPSLAFSAQVTNRIDRFDSEMLSGWAVEKLEVDEQALTDITAAEQWENYTLPTRKSEFVGGIHALTDLGF